MTLDDAPRASRRAVLGTCGALLASLAGCSGLLGTDADDDRTATDPPTPRSGSASVGTGDLAAASTPTAAPRRAEPLHLQTAGDLRRVGSRLAHAWNANRSPDEPGEWSAAAEAVGTDARLADHFAAEHGIDPTRTRSEPPFELAPSASAPKPVARNLAAGRVDLGGTDRDAIEEAGSDGWSNLAGHTVAREGQAFVVSPALAEAGVTGLTAAQIRDIYAGEVGTWAAVGGPDREPYVVAGPNGTPSPRIQREFFDHRPLDGVDVRFGRHENRAEVVRERDDAVAHLAVGMAAGRLSAPTVVVEGTAHDVRDPGYPTTYPAALYTRGDPDDREAAVIDALASPLGRRLVGRERDLVAPPE